MTRNSHLAGRSLKLALLFGTTYILYISIFDLHFEVTPNAIFTEGVSTRQKLRAVLPRLVGEADITRVKILFEFDLLSFLIVIDQHLDGVPTDRTVQNSSLVDDAGLLQHAALSVDLAVTLLVKLACLLVFLIRL